MGDAKKAKLSRIERQGLDEWRPLFTRQNSSGFRLLVDLCAGDLGAASVELLEANDRDNPQHRAWHKQLRDGRRAGGEKVRRADDEGDADA